MLATKEETSILSSKFIYLCPKYCFVFGKDLVFVGSGVLNVPYRLMYLDIRSPGPGKVMVSSGGKPCWGKYVNDGGACVFIV